MAAINEPTGRGRKANRAAALLLALPLALACGRKPSEQETREAREKARASLPTAARCYLGCLDLNEGKPIERRELEHNCEERCMEICTKNCHTLRADSGPARKIEADCEEDCEREVKRR